MAMLIREDALLSKGQSLGVMSEEYQPCRFCLHVVSSFPNSLCAIPCKRSCCQVLGLRKFPLFYVKLYILLIPSVIYSSDMYHVPTEYLALGVKGKWDTFVSRGTNERDGCGVVRKVKALYSFLESDFYALVHRSSCFHTSWFPWQK